MIEREGLNFATSGGSIPDEALNMTEDEERVNTDRPIYMRETSNA